MPRARTTSPTAAWTCSAGRVPAERAWWRPLAARSKRAWLICDRLAFCVQTNSTRTTASSDEHVEQRAGLRLEMAREPVVGPDAGLGDVDQPGITQLRHVMGEGGLTQIEGGGEVADTDRLCRAPQDADHLQSRGIGQRLEHLHRLVHFGDRHRHRGWATDPFDTFRVDGFHLCSVSDPLTTVYASARLPSTAVNLSREGDMDTIRESVRAKYAQTAITLRDGGSCCDASCCGGSDAASGPIAADEYSKAEVADLGLSLGASLGCGNPTALAQLHAGEVVLDLGSGAGLDVLLSARRVSPGGAPLGGGDSGEMVCPSQQKKNLAGGMDARILSC